MKDNDKYTSIAKQLKRLVKESKRLNEKKYDYWTVSCDPTYFHEEYSDVQSEFMEMLEQYDWDVSNPDAKAAIKAFLEKNGNPKIVSAFRDTYTDGVMLGIEFNNEAAAYDWAEILWDDGQTYIDDMVAQGPLGDDIDESRILKEYEFSDDGYDDEGNYGGLDAKYDWEHRHGGIYSDPDEVTPYQRRRKHGKWWPNARGDMPGYGDPETWGGREPR
jgi:hypothetical protein